MHSGTDNVVLLSIYDRFTRKDVPWPDDPEGEVRAHGHALDLAARQAANARKNGKKAATAPKMASGRPDHYLSASESDSDDRYGLDLSLRKTSKRPRGSLTSALVGSASPHAFDRCRARGASTFVSSRCAKCTPVLYQIRLDESVQVHGIGNERASPPA